MRRGEKRWILWVLVLLFSAAATYLYLKPKSLEVLEAVPSGALVYGRLDHMGDHLKSLQSSKFWAGITGIDISKFLEHEAVGSQKIEVYAKWRNDIRGVINSPFFKQFLGRETAFALYPQFDDFSNGNWPRALSGALLIVRPDSQGQLTEMLGGLWNQYSKEWNSSVDRYKNIAITAVTLKSSAVTVYYARIDDLLFLSVDKRIAHRVIDIAKTRSGLIKDDPNFIVTKASLYDASDGEVFMDVPAAKMYLQNHWQSLFEREEGDESLTQAKVEEFLGSLNGIDAAGGSFLSGKPLRFKWVVLFDPAKSSPELNRLNSCVTTDNPTMSMVPKDAMAYQWTGCVDFSAQYQKLKQLKRISESADEEPFGELEKTWGLSIERDIIPVLGNEVGWFVNDIEVGGFFPFPKFALFLKVSDPKKAEEILKKIVTTPLTLVQNEDYRSIRINFVTVPLINSFRPSYGFVNGHLVIATSDKILKQSIDTAQDPTLSMATEPLFKQGITDNAGFMLSFVKTGEIARQSKSLVGWVDNWFSLKIQQAETDLKATKQKAQVLAEEIRTKEQALISVQERLDRSRQEKSSLEAQVQASSVVMEAKNTLSQQGAVAESSVPEDVRPEKLLESKKSQISAMELEIYGLQKDIEAAKARQPDFMDDLNDFENQKLDALKYRYYIDDVIVPVLQGLESLLSQKVTTKVKDSVIESEMFLVAE